MKNRKVLNLRTHIGTIKGTKTSVDSVQHEAEMELTAVGVVVHSIKGVSQDILIPFSNIIEVQLAPDVEEEKRGPGRPPGPRAA